MKSAIKPEIELEDLQENLHTLESLFGCALSGMSIRGELNSKKIHFMMETGFRLLREKGREGLVLFREVFEA